MKIIIQNNHSDLVTGNPYFISNSFVQPNDFINVMTLFRESRFVRSSAATSARTLLRPIWNTLKFLHSIVGIQPFSVLRVLVLVRAWTDYNQVFPLLIFNNSKFKLHSATRIFELFYLLIKIPTGNPSFVYQFPSSNG